MEPLEQDVEKTPSEQPLPQDDNLEDLGPDSTSATPRAQSKSNEADQVTVLVLGHPNAAPRLTSAITCIVAQKHQPAIPRRGQKPLRRIMKELMRLSTALRSAAN